LRRLHQQYGTLVQFVDVLIRQAHPGELRGPYRSYDQKRESAREYQRLEEIPWTVLVDDLEGTVHAAYGGMADPAYLIDVEGRVAFYGMWTSAPKLRQAMDELLALGGTGWPVAAGVDRVPHLAASLVYGWRGLRRGGNRAVAEYNRATLGWASLSYLGYLARPLLAPLALRAEPLPLRGRLALGGVLGLATALMMGRRGL